jgi:hypothetical protein
MKAYERREAGAYPYFKLVTWDTTAMTWRAGKRILPTKESAEATAKKTGRYRVERFDEQVSRFLEPFEVSA